MLEQKHGSPGPSGILPDLAERNAVSQNLEERCSFYDRHPVAKTLATGFAYSMAVGGVLSLCVLCPPVVIASGVKALYDSWHHHDGPQHPTHHTFAYV